MVTYPAMVLAMAVLNAEARHGFATWHVEAKWMICR